MFDVNGLTILAKELLCYGYKPNELIIFFNSKDFPEETMKRVAENLGDIEIEPVDYLMDGKIYILKKQDIDEHNWTWDKDGNRIDGRKYSPIPELNKQRYLTTNQAISYLQELLKKPPTDCGEIKLSVEKGIIALEKIQAINKVIIAEDLEDEKRVELINEIVTTGWWKENQNDNC